MPPVRMFSSLGLFVREGFLSGEECRALAASMMDGPGELAGIFGESPEGEPNPEVRRAYEVDVTDEQSDLVDARLAEIRGELERHFSLSLDAPDAAAYLRYPPGAFYLPHTDRRATPDESHAHQRAISVVLFVNGPDDDPPFSGGHLRFYGLLDEGPLSDVGLDAEPEGGTLVAFPSTLLHEVTPIERGVRCSVVAWFTDAEG